jgi:hypothetical protein
LLVLSKKLENTVIIGIATAIEIKNEVKYQIFIFLKYMLTLFYLVNIINRRVRTIKLCSLY